MAEKQAGTGGKPRRPPLKPGPDGIVRLAGGNPQIAKGDGVEKVLEYIAAMPGWQRQAGERMHAIITGAVPQAVMSVKWNTPFYGTDPKHWFVSFHCLTKYVKVAFPDGTSLDPVPPGNSKQKNVRYYDVYEGDFDEARFADWVKQASQLRGDSFS